MYSLIFYLQILVRSYNFLALFRSFLNQGSQQQNKERHPLPSCKGSWGKLKLMLSEI
jgi:hypothetical protein